jgi:hypothetical protein
MKHALIIAAVFSCTALSARHSMADEPAAELPGSIIEQLAVDWPAGGWGAEGSARYLRPLAEENWRKRFGSLQRLVQLGEPAVAPLVESLRHDSVEVRIFAAQALGYLYPHSASSSKALLDSLETDSSAAVRLYAADSLGMLGLGEELAEELSRIRTSEKNGDVKKHLGYVLMRKASPIDTAVIDTLKDWKLPAGTGDVGQLAPDFQLDALNGESVKLSSFRGKSPVVLIFLYGDT